MFHCTVLVFHKMYPLPEVMRVDERKNGLVPVQAQLETCEPPLQGRDNSSVGLAL